MSENAESKKGEIFQVANVFDVHFLMASPTFEPIKTQVATRARGLLISLPLASD